MHDTMKKMSENTFKELILQQENSGERVREYFNGEEHHSALVHFN